MSKKIFAALIVAVVVTFAGYNISVTKNRGDNVRFGNGKCGGIGRFSRIIG